MQWTKSNISQKWSINILWEANNRFSTSEVTFQFIKRVPSNFKTWENKRWELIVTEASNENHSNTTVKDIQMYISRKIRELASTATVVMLAKHHIHMLMHLSISMLRQTYALLTSHICLHALNKGYGKGLELVLFWYRFSD